MPAPRSTPLPASAFSGAWHQRFVPLLRFGALQKRQHEGRVIRRGRSRAPIIGGRARQTERNQISRANGHGGKGLVKHGALYHQRKIRQSERFTCSNPTIGHNSGMNTTERTAKYFGVSLNKATEMLKEANNRNAAVQAKGEALAQRAKEGKRIPYITR